VIDHLTSGEVHKTEQNYNHPAAD